MGKNSWGEHLVDKVNVIYLNFRALNFHVWLVCKSCEEKQLPKRIPKISYA